jgi:uncharacterized protein (DUF4213/DUF364 family)
MELNDRLFTLMASHAQKVRIDHVCLGLRYTAVTTSDGGIGLAYTMGSERHRPTEEQARYVDWEGRPALDLLEKIKSSDPGERSQALALVNALNYGYALMLPEDPHNRILFKTCQVDTGCKVAMVGYFGPLVAYFETRGVALEIIDQKRGLGQKDRFYEKLRTWADVLLLSATSLLNSTTEEVISQTSRGVKTILLGPSTPMIAEAFAPLPVHMLAGTVPIDKDKVLKAVRHGMGTRVIHRYSKKVFWAERQRRVP